MFNTKKKQVKKKPLSKKFWIIAGVIILVLVAGYFGKSYWDTYHDRPLADGLQYIGRDYNSPCFLGDCYGPTTEIYYYATNIEPKDVVKLFPNVRLVEVTHVNRSLWNNKGSSEVYGYNFKTHDGALGGYSHVVDKNAVISASRLLPTDKAHIIKIRKDSYDKLHE